MLLGVPLESLPVARMDLDTLHGLLDYSCSVPTHLPIGKFWRCNLGAYTPTRHPNPTWILRGVLGLANDRQRLTTWRIRFNPVNTEESP